MKIQAPRGTEDILPGQSEIWQALESQFAGHVHRYGYQEIRTPVFEETELFKRSAGETSDIVSKEMYEFRDKGDRDLSLKPEGTAPAMRAVIEHSLCPPGTHLRLWYKTPIFRYGRPGRGRLRQAHQFGCELLGSDSAAADAEVIEVAQGFLAAIGLTDEPVGINSIGRTECRTRYASVVLDHIATYLADLDTETQAKINKNPLGVLDSKDPKAKIALVGVPPITDYLEEESRARFDQLQQLLTDAEVSYRVAPEIVRGLDYYTETVFEFESAKLEGLSIYGGGRYDTLVKELGGAPLPCVGFGIGIERIVLALTAAKKLPTMPYPDIFMVEVTSDVRDHVRRVVRDLRFQGFAVHHDIDGRSMKSQLRQADKSGAKFAVLIGTNELETETVKVRNLNNGDQVEIPITDLSEHLNKTP